MIKKLLPLFLILCLSAAFCVPALADDVCKHIPDEQIVAYVPATCGEDGYITYTCTVCGQEYTEILPADGEHSYCPKPDEMVQPDCRDGYAVYTCMVCGQTLTVTYPAIENHNYVVAETVPATCTEDGYEVYRCSICGEAEYTVTLPNAGGHTWSEKPDEIVEPNCGDDGYARYSCTVCGETYDEVLPAQGEHEWGEKPTDIVEATCVDDGYIEYTCTLCGAAKCEVVPATGDHIIVPDPGYDATETADGLTEGAHCSVCGLVIIAQQVIPATGSDESDEPDDTVKGDLNGDGMVNIIDALRLFRYVNGQIDSIEPYNGDINDDSTVNIIDALRLFRYVNGQIEEL